MMKMADMKRKASALSEAVDMPEKGYYPYGIQLSLSDDDIKKLVLDFDDLDIGSDVMIVAKAKVKRLESSESAKSATLQITEMCVHQKEEKENKKPSMKDYLDKSLRK